MPLSCWLLTTRSRTVFRLPMQYGTRLMRSPTYDGHGAAGVGLTGVLYETRGYQVQANGAVGVGFDTSVVGARGGIGVFW